MKKLLTLCIYEHPAAIYDLDHWEDRFWLYIRSMVVTKSYRTYTMKPRNNATEIVYCLPSSDFFNDVHKSGSEFYDALKLPICDEFNKAILVGSFNWRTLANISTYIRLLDNKGKC